MYESHTRTAPRVNNMSRPSIAPQRALTLTEELEKLEQSITLTLQGGYLSYQFTLYAWLIRTEIDHNFSRAHRIVTTSILPVVEQYGKHSEAVWEGSKVNTLPISEVGLCVDRL